MTDNERDSPGVVAPPPLIYLGPLVLGLLLNERLPVPFLPRKMTRGLGWPLLGNGVLLMNWFLWTLRSAGNPVNPQKPVSSLVTDGPLQYTRNPSYLSMAMIYTGIASLASAFWAILFLPATLAVIRRGVIEREERYLERRFGEEYLRYKGRVRRWI